MVAKAVLLFCAQALLVQYISTQYIGAPCAAPFGFPYAEAPLGAPCGAFAPAASSGGGFPVRSMSPLAVTGVSVTSDNVYEGPLAVTGAVPFLGAVALEGGLPTAGAGAVSYGCGDGSVTMISEDIAAFPGPYAYGPGSYEAAVAAPGYGYGFNRGCGGPYL